MHFIENSLDVGIYTDLRKSVGWTNCSEIQVELLITRSDYTIVAYDEGTPIAMGRIHGDGMYYMINDVIVRPEYQRKGIGTEIMNRLIQFIKTHMDIGYRVSINLNSEVGKEQFYEKFGFRTLPHEYCGSGMRKVIKL
ncbi:MAG: GCN5-related N-acetyltransferase [Herbinix sp.]|jgi:GNAT superfamily N-acetyltransferase|nr:GCN5-related N-acetyltransferase [Herbinix sp.]